MSNDGGPDYHNIAKCASTMSDVAKRLQNEIYEENWPYYTEILFEMMADASAMIADIASDLEHQSLCKEHDALQQEFDQNLKHLETGLEPEVQNED